MKTTTIPLVERTSLYLKSVVVKLDVYEQLAGTFIEYMTCELAGVPVEVRGVVVKGDKLENSSFMPVKVTDDSGRYSFDQYCTKMGWDFVGTIEVLNKAYKAEMLV